MQSIKIPNKVNIYISNTYIKRVSDQGTFVKKIGDYKFFIITKAEESRLFVKGFSNQDEANILGQIAKQRIGLTNGFRKRLRINGMGFRARIQSYSSNNKSRLFPKNREGQKETFKEKQMLALKLGFSHEYAYPIDIALQNNVKIRASRLEGRTKGTIINVEGPELRSVSRISQHIQNFRRPDIYKGKGMLTSTIALKLKKGKRQN
jgi:ribosomal protein L6P/L9E